MEKKKSQLGMNPSTASHRLVKDILFNFIKDRPCCKCGKALTRETFTIEHIKPWLDSEDPIGLYFNLDNIGFSHFICNVKSARRINKTTNEEKETKRQHDNKIRREKLKAEYSPEIRRKKWLEKGY